MQLELLKEEFKEKYQRVNPVLTDLTMWCLEHEYPNRPDFIELEQEIDKADFSNYPLVSEIVPVNSTKKINLKSQIKEKENEEFLKTLDFHDFKRFVYICK